MTLIDVKSTRGNFNGRIHISYNELLQMSIVARYDLYRVYEITDDHMKLRIAQGLSKFAEKVISVMGNLPFGVQPDSVSVSPDSLPFSREIIVKVTET